MRETVEGKIRFDDILNACDPMEPKPHVEIAGGNPQVWLEGLNRGLFDSALDCIITMDASGRVVAATFNGAGARPGFRNQFCID